MSSTSSPDPEKGQREQHGAQQHSQVKESDHDDTSRDKGVDQEPKANAANGDLDPWEVKWQDDDADPENLRAMSLIRKWVIVVVLSCTSFCVTCTSSMYTSTYGQMTVEFGCSRLVATLGLSTFITGLGVGPILFGPFSEFYGRRPIYLASLCFFIVWIIPCAVAKNIETMIVARFLNGFSGSAFLSVAGGTVGDMFNKKELQAPMLVYTSSPFLGPAIGPVLSGFINQYTDWRWTFYTLLIWSFVTLCMVIVFVPETYHPVLLRQRAVQLRRETGEERWRARIEKTQKSIPRTLATSIMRPMQLLFLEPMCLNLCLFSAILLGILYLFFGAFPVVFEGKHGFTLSQTGLAFIGLFAGMAAAWALDPYFHRQYLGLLARHEKETGDVGGSEPEFRLPQAVVGAILVPIGLFWFGWTTYSSIHWIVPIMGSAVFGMGTILVYSGIFTFLVDAYPLYAASALAANSLARSTFAAVFPLFGVQMYHKLGDQWATSLLAFLTLVMAPFPWIFYKYGKRIRGTSRFAAS